jgi:hypothetical protein
MVRRLGEAGTGGGVVLVAGLEERPTPAMSLSSAPLNRGLARLMGAADLVVQDMGAYQLVHPPGYEVLADTRVQAPLPEAFETQRASIALGAGTDLYTALALFSELLQFTILADNVLSDGAWCGELYVDNAPAPAVLQAILQSALIAPNAFVMEAGPTHLFLRSVANQSLPDSCLNRAALEPASQAWLQQPIDLRIPQSGGSLQFRDGYLPLQTLLPSLSEALGVPVLADPDVADFPVYPAVFAQVPAETLLSLIVRQWPYDRFGYSLTTAGVRFHTRLPQ